MRRPAVLVLAATGALAALLAWWAVASADGDGGVSLPAAAGVTAAAYAVRYQVETPDSTSTEELVVRRPFDSRLLTSTSAGDSERVSRLGLLGTRSIGADWILIDVPPAPASADTRLDALAPALVAAGVVEEIGTDDVGGRDCVVYRSIDPRDGIVTERCVDADGIVLRDRWIDRDGTEVRRATATAIRTGDAGALDEELGGLPDAERLGAERGGGAVRAAADDEVPPFAQTFAFDPGGDWELVGRFQVVPPRLGADAAELAQDPGVALYSDVWRRGPDLLVFDQGATTGGPAPFAPGDPTEPVVLDGLGPAEVALTDRLVELRVLLDDDGFLRLAGTVPPDEVLRLADRIVPTGGGR